MLGRRQLNTQLKTVSSQRLQVRRSLDTCVCLTHLGSVNLPEADLVMSETGQPEVFSLAGVQSSLPAAGSGAEYQPRSNGVA